MAASVGKPSLLPGRVLVVETQGLWRDGLEVDQVLGEVLPATSSWRFSGSLQVAMIRSTPISDTSRASAPDTKAERLEELVIPTTPIVPAITPSTSSRAGVMVYPPAVAGALRRLSSRMSRSRDIAGTPWERGA